MQEVKQKPKSEKEIRETAKIYPLKCPICGVNTNYVSFIHETKDNQKALWYHCSCGIIFQQDYPAHTDYNAKYVIGYRNFKQSELRSVHAARTYAPLIEELTYGRMMLDVGYNLTYNMDYFEKRGWLVWGIDINSSLKGHDNIYQGDFLTYDFTPHVVDPEMKKFIEEKQIKRTFDLIWMGHVFEHFNDPLGALHRAYDLLSESGVLFIATPDIEFINKTGIPEYPHWKKKEHYILWSERALVRETERIGFRTIMKRRNFSSRFVSWYDIHLICQKRFF